MTGQEMEQLVLKAKKGSKEAKERIIKQFHPLLLKNIMKYFCINQEVEDWLQEGRVVILRAIGEYKWELGVPFAAYVQKQVFYFFVNERKKIREEVILDQPLKEGKNTLKDFLGDDNAQIEEAIIQNEDRKSIVKAVDSLSPKQREVIISYYLQRKSLKTLARERKVCYQAVVKTKAKALDKLRREMGPGAFFRGQG